MKLGNLIGASKHGRLFQASMMYRNMASTPELAGAERPSELPLCQHLHVLARIYHLDTLQGRA